MVISVCKKLWMGLCDKVCTGRCIFLVFSCKAIVICFSRGPHGNLAFITKCVLPSENKVVYYYYFNH